MSSCKHTCPECGTSWNCGYPYLTDEFYERSETITAGTYCNAYCPSCQTHKREELTELFESMTVPSYYKKSLGYS